MSSVTLLNYQVPSCSHIHAQLLNHVQLFTISWTVAHQVPMSMEFLFRQEYWTGLSFPPLGNLPDPAIKTTSLALAGRFFTTEPPGKCPMWLVRRYVFDFFQLVLNWKC